MRRVDAVVASAPWLVEQRVERPKRGLGAARLGHRHGVVRADHRARRPVVQHPVEGLDLRPVGVLGRAGLGVHCGDRRLQLIRADGSGGQKQPRRVRHPAR